MSAKLKTVDIKGKDYVMVNERVKALKSNPQFKNHKIVTKLITHDSDHAVFKASILNENNEVVAVGHAHETQASSYINKTSHYENAETSAVGRALGFLGIGIDTSICSANEVEMAIELQEIEKSKSSNNDMISFGKYMGKRFSEIDREELIQYCKYMKEKNPEASGPLKEFLDSSRTYLSKK